MKYAFLDLPKPVAEEIVKALIQLRDKARRLSDTSYDAPAYEQYKVIRANAEYVGALKIAKILGIDETLLYTTANYEQRFTVNS